MSDNRNQLMPRHYRRQASTLVLISALSNQIPILMAEQEKRVGSKRDHYDQDLDASENAGHVALAFW